MEVDLRQAAGAPDLAEAPLPWAIATLQMNLFSEDPIADELGRGNVFLLGPNGQWRTLNLQAAGSHGRLFPEMHAELDKRGARLALQDEFGILVVDVASGNAERFPVETFRPSGLKWIDRDELAYFPREHTRAPGFVLSTRTGLVTKSPVDVRNMAVNERGVGYLLEADSVTLIDRSGDDTPVELVEPIRRVGVVGPTSHGLVPTVVRGTGPDAPRGVLLVDGRSGGFRALLAGRIADYDWVGIPAWADERRIVIFDGYSGELLLWSFANRGLFGLAQVANQGTTISIAGDRVLTAKRSDR